MNKLICIIGLSLASGIKDACLVLFRTRRLDLPTSQC
uniref:Hypotheticial protein n=1 Tax=Schistosoma japonicum TaxID=6182 RepID=C7TY81_SCHJA|nr:hypotheticial protein [Schistosoma japonicum]